MKAITTVILMLFLIGSVTGQSIDKVYDGYSEKINGSLVNHRLKKGDKIKTMEYGGKTWEFVRNYPLHNEFEVMLTSGKGATYALPDFWIATNGVASMSIDERGKLYGIIDGTSIEPIVSEYGSHASFGEFHNQSPGDEYCPFIEVPNPALDSLLERPKFYSLNDIDVARKIIKIHIEIDYDVYQKRAYSVGATIRFVTSIFNEVNNLCKRDGFNVQLGSILIHDKQSPYVNDVSSRMLDQFVRHSPKTVGDLDVYGSHKSSGGIAYYRTLGHPLETMRRSFVNLRSNYDQFPRYSWNVMVIAHELGHNLGSKHTHSCAWNGNNTAIDACAGGTEGGCPSPPDPIGGGTIMSYCHMTRGGVNFEKGFGPQPQAAIYEVIDNTNGLEIENLTTNLCFRPDFRGEAVIYHINLLDNRGHKSVIIVDGSEKAFVHNYRVSHRGTMLRSTYVNIHWNGIPHMGWMVGSGYYMGTKPQ